MPQLNKIEQFLNSIFTNNFMNSIQFDSILNGLLLKPMSPINKNFLLRASDVKLIVLYFNGNSTKIFHNFAENWVFEEKISITADGQMIDQK